VRGTAKPEVEQKDEGEGNPTNKKKERERDV